MRKSITEKPTFEYEINTGMYVMSPSVINLIKPAQYCDMPELIERCISDGRAVTRFPIEGYWLDIGSKSDYALAQKDIRRLEG